MSPRTASKYHASGSRQQTFDKSSRKVVTFRRNFRYSRGDMAKVATKLRAAETGQDSGLGLTAGAPRWSPKAIFTVLKRLSKQKVTIMFIPHSDRKIGHFSINALGLLVIGLFTLALVISFFFLATMYSGTEQGIVEKSVSLEEVRSHLGTTLAQVKDLMKIYQDFQGTMAGTLKEMNINATASESSPLQGGDLAKLEDAQELSSTEVREVLDIKRLSKALSDAINPLNEISDAWKTQKKLLSDIPNLWPVVGGRSAISMEFGPTRHPIRGDWYVNRGVDISGQAGLSIVASANGKVTDVHYDAQSGYGASVEIEHKYGFRTRYTNLGTWIVSPGDEVYQGQRIGTMGNSGVSTGNHFHFEIMMGTQVLDPASFLKISTDFSRASGKA